MKIWCCARRKPRDTAVRRRAERSVERDRRPAAPEGAAHDNEVSIEEHDGGFVRDDVAEPDASGVKKPADRRQRRDDAGQRKVERRAHAGEHQTHTRKQQHRRDDLVPMGHRHCAADIIR